MSWKKRKEEGGREGERQRERGRAGRGGGRPIRCRKPERESCWSRPNRTHRRAPPPPWHGHTPSRLGAAAQRLTPLSPTISSSSPSSSSSSSSSGPIDLVSRHHFPPACPALALTNRPYSTLAAPYSRPAKLIFHSPHSSSASTHLPGVSLARSIALALGSTRFCRLWFHSSLSPSPAHPCSCQHGLRLRSHEAAPGPARPGQRCR